jgi:hypothetical protein
MGDDSQIESILKIVITNKFLPYFFQYPKEELETFNKEEKILKMLKLSSA